MMNQFSMNKVSFTRRIVSFLLALIMVTSLSAPAGAFLIAVTTTESRFTEGSFEETSPDGSYSVHVNYGTDAGIPEGARLVTSEVTDAASYQSVVEAKLPAGKTAVLSRFFDIDIVSESGESVQLQAPVEVVIEVADAPMEDTTGVSVFHFADDRSAPSSMTKEEVEITEGEVPLAAPELMMRGMRSASVAPEGVMDDAVLTDEQGPTTTEEDILSGEENAGGIEEVPVTGNSEGTVSFLANGFSVYGVVYTVDLKYNSETGTLSYDDDKLTVTVSAKEKDILPDEAVLIVREVVPEDETTAEIYARAITVLSHTLREQRDSFSTAKVYDFTILDKEGNEIEPSGNVDVKIEFKDKLLFDNSLGGESEIQIAHLAEDPTDDEAITVEILDANIDSTDLGTVSSADFSTDSFSAYIVFNRNGISDTEPTDLGNYGWIRFYTVGEQDTTLNQTGDPDSSTIQWGYYKNDGSNLPAVNTAWAYRRILKVRLWLPKSGADSSVYDGDHYNETATAQYFWVWQNEVNIEEFELPGYEVVHTRMHTAWDEENGKQPVENDSLVGSYAVRGYRRSTISEEPGAKNSDLNVLDVYAKPLPQTTGMNYIIRYVHADGSVTDGNVRSLASGSVTYDASQYIRDGETYAGTSIVTGSEAINANTTAGTGTITYNPNVSLAKVYVYYKIDPDGNGNPNTRGRYDKDENGYYTGEIGLYTDKSAQTVTGKDRQFILNLESWYVDNAASVGMVLDASGSMAWTSGEPEPIILTDDQVAEVRRANGMWQDGWGNWHGNNDIFFNGGTNDSAGNPPNSGQYITNISALSLILDKTKTDNSAMGYNGYHYYLKDMRSTVREYVALGYSDGNQSGSEDLGGKSIYTTQIGNTSYSATVLANRFIKNQNNAYGPNEGWYYVNSTGNTKAYLKYTGKSYDGYSSKGWWPSSSDQQMNLAGGPLRFYIKTGTNELWVSYYDATGNGTIRQSPVYEKRDKMFTKMETLQDAVSQFGAIVLGSSPESQIGLTRFSQQVGETNNDKQPFTYTSYLPLLNWSSSTEELSAAMNLSKNAKGSTNRNDDGLTVYEYGLTGQTRTWTGVKAYSDYLKDNATAANHKYLVIFTDGKDTNGDADSSTWGNTGTQVQQLKNAGYTIITVMMRSQAMVGSEYTTAKAFLQGIASPGLDGNSSNTSADNKLYFEADSNSTKDVIDAFRQIANRIASGLNGYTVRDYIDPRFDVLNDAGDVLTVLDSNGQFTNATNPDVDAETGLRAFTTPDNKQAYLGYDASKKMFYVLWKDQEIPASTLKSESVNPWKSQIRIQAKEDLLGGNDILSNGNETGMNQVYYPDPTDTSGMTPKTGDQYPKKDFPKTTVNPATYGTTLLDYEDTIFLNETISPINLFDKVSTMDDETADDNHLSVYVGYLARAGKKLHNDENYYINILKNGALPTGHANVNGEVITTTEELVTITLPYYYLKDENNIRSYAGGNLHQADKVGTITYTWTAITTGDHTLTDGNAFKDFTSTTLDTVKYQLSVSYTPDPVVPNDVIPDNGSARTLVLTGQGGASNALIRDPVGGPATSKSTDTSDEGFAIVHVVAGKIGITKKIAKQELDDKGIEVSNLPTVTFTITKDGETYKTVAFNMSKSTLKDDYYEFTAWETDLPKGTYTVSETSGDGYKLDSFEAVTVQDDSTTTDINESQFAAKYSADSNAKTVTWYIGPKGEADERQPGISTYPNCETGTVKFPYDLVSDVIEHVDPALAEENGKFYLNGQIGQAVYINTLNPLVVLKKADVGNPSSTINGAVFDFYKEVPEETPDAVSDIVPGECLLKLQTVTSGDFPKNDGGKLDGYVLLGELDRNSTYYLVETVIPDGYNAPGWDYIKVTFNNNDEICWTAFKKENVGNPSICGTPGSAGKNIVDGKNCYTVTVYNNPGVELPSTGGHGTAAFLISGLTLALTSGAVLTYRRSRTSAGKKEQ